MEGPTRGFPPGAKRGGLRVIYYWWSRGTQFWLFTLHDKNEASDLAAKERHILKGLLDAEWRARGVS